MKQALQLMFTDKAQTYTVTCWCLTTHVTSTCDWCDKPHTVHQLCVCVCVFVHACHIFTSLLLLYVPLQHKYTGWHRINHTFRPFNRVYQNLHKIRPLTLVALIKFLLPLSLCIFLHWSLFSLFAVLDCKDIQITPLHVINLDLSPQPIMTRSCSVMSLVR